MTNRRFPVFSFFALLGFSLVCQAPAADIVERMLDDGTHVVFSRTSKVDGVKRAYSQNDYAHWMDSVKTSFKDLAPDKMPESLFYTMREIRLGSHVLKLKFKGDGRLAVSVEHGGKTSAQMDGLRVDEIPFLVTYRVFNPSVEFDAIKIKFHNADEFLKRLDDRFSTEADFSEAKHKIFKHYRKKFLELQERCWDRYEGKGVWLKTRKFFWEISYEKMDQELFELLIALRRDAGNLGFSANETMEFLKIGYFDVFNAFVTRGGNSRRVLLKLAEIRLASAIDYWDNKAEREQSPIEIEFVGLNLEIRAEKDGFFWSKPDRKPGLAILRWKFFGEERSFSFTTGTTEKRKSLDWIKSMPDWQEPFMKDLQTALCQQALIRK